MALSSSYQILKEEYETRRKRNKRYSLRAFAATLNMSPGRLHEILNGRHNLSLKMAKRFADKLNFDEDRTSYFLRLVESEIYLRTDGRKRTVVTGARLLSDDEFSLISDWEYFAFMALVETTTFRSEVPWVAKKLAISEERANVVIDHLISQGLLLKNDSGEYKNSHSTMSTLIDVPSEIVRKANIECIQQVIEKIEKIDVTQRDVSSLTIPVDPQKMAEVKALIRDFKSRVTALMSEGQTTEVYNLNIQFMPVSELGV